MELARGGGVRIMQGVGEVGERLSPETDSSSSEFQLSWGEPGEPLDKLQTS